MEENSSKSSINPSSMVDLKAELFRKQEEFKTQKLLHSTHIKGRVTEKKPNIWSKKNSGVLERAQRDLEAKTEEENSLEKSRKALASKAKIYDKMTQGAVPDEDGSKIFLVDFEKKAIDNIFAKRERERRSEEEKTNILEEIPEPKNPDEQWVEFTDSLGRARTCMKKDLPELIKQDKALGIIRAPQKGDKPDLLSEDMRKELERQQWEKEEEEAVNKPVGPIHYADVQHKEIRDHGVAFYQFSQEENQRREEMERLMKLREQTKDQRARREQLKEKRKAMLESRLAKVKQRKMLREGGGVFAQATLSEESKIEEKVEDKKTPVSSQVETTPVEEMIASIRKEGEKTKPVVREWDIGKTEYLHLQWERRKQNLEDERDPEFAPPSCYRDNVGSGGQFGSAAIKKSKGRDYSRLDPNPPQVKVFTREEYETKFPHKKPQTDLESDSTINNSKTCETFNELGDIPLPAPSVEMTTTDSQFTYRESAIQDPGFQIPFYDPSILPPPVIDVSQPPPNFFQPTIPPFVTETGYIVPVFTETVNTTVTVPKCVPGKPTLIHTNSGSVPLVTSHDPPVILSKSQIVDTRYIKNKEAPILHGAADSSGTAVEASDWIAPEVTNPVISAGPVKYDTNNSG